LELIWYNLNDLIDLKLTSTNDKNNVVKFKINNEDYIYIYILNIKIEIYLTNLDQ